MNAPRTCGLLLLVVLLRVDARSQHDSASWARPVPSIGTFREEFRLLPHDSLIRLSRGFLISGSERLLLDSIPLQPDVDYTLDHARGVIRLLIDRRRASTDTTGQVLSVEARRLPSFLKQEYTLFRMAEMPDSVGRQLQPVRPSPAPFSLGSAFGPGLSKSGSITRGLTVGTNRDLSLNSGFRLQLAGPLADDIEVVAALTDESSPIQPEGTTQTLQELDRVFVQIRNPRYGVTLGDFNLEVDQAAGGEFGKLFRKLQGAQGRAQVGDEPSSSTRARIDVTGGSPRGSFTSNAFQGREGNQGPYQLAGTRGERRILVVAGTERVYLNGELMTRGETNDYVIDYASAELTFSSKRLITSASRIVVDFEYTDRNFERNILAAAASVSLWRDRLRVNTVLFQEGDDPDSGIEFELDDTSRSVLQQAGADRFAAALPGARYAGRDPVTGAGLGQYRVADTSIAGRGYRVYRYAPGNPDAVYSVSFSIVDRMPPDSLGYRRIRLGHFEPAGVGQGNYLPVRFLPLPQQRRLAAFSAAGSVREDLVLSGEYALSDADFNRLSDRDDAGSAGSAFRFGLRYNPKRLVIGSVNLGSLDLSLSERFVGRRFEGMDRFNEVEFDRKWNELPLAGRADEEIREGTLRYSPVASLSVGGTYGLRSLSGALRSERLEGNVSLQDSLLPRLSYRVENISSRGSAPALSSDWLRQQAALEYGIGVVTPSVRLESEERRIWEEPDSLVDRGVRFLELAPALDLAGIGPWRARAEYAVRTEDSTVQGSFQKAFRSGTQRYVFELREWNALSSALTVHVRNLSYTSFFRARGNSDVQTVLARSENRFAPLRRGVQLDLFYELASERSARLERVFLRVPQGTGSYRYRGDLNGNGLADEEEFELVRFDGDYTVIQIPGEQLEPVVEVKASARLRITPARFLGAQEGPLASVLRRLSSETFARVDERSTDENVRNVSTLRLATFQNPATTIAGFTWFRQDVHLDEQSPEFSLRLRHEQRRGLTQLVSATERSLLSEQSARLRFQPVRDLGGVGEYVQRRDRVTATSVTPRERDLSMKTLSADLFYRPEDRVEVGVRLGVTAGTDRNRGEDAAADLNEQSVRLVYAIPARGQVRAEVTREEVVFTRPYRDPARLIPFELTGGRVIGKSLLWSLAFEYRIDQHVQVRLGYDGRTEGRRSPVHTARAEVRAAF